MMKQTTKQWLGYGSIALFVMLWLWSMSAEAGGYHHNTVNNYYSEQNHYNTVTNITNLTGISEKDLATATAMAGAAGQHHFSKSISTWQGSFAGSCYDSGADDCGLSLAIGKRHKDVLFSGSVSGASDERLYGFSVGFTW